MKKVRVIITILALAGISMMGCAYQLQNPVPASSNSTDAVTVYVAPYHVDQSIGAPHATWERDLFIKKAIAERMAAKFVEDPTDAKFSIETEKFDISVWNYNIYSTMRINRIQIEEIVHHPGEWTHSRNEKAFLQFANGDADMVSIILQRFIEGQTFKKAKGTIVIGDERKYKELRNLKFE